MKLTLSNVKELKRNTKNPLTKHVCNYVINRWSTMTTRSISSLMCWTTAANPAL